MWSHQLMRHSESVCQREFRSLIPRLICTIHDVLRIVAVFRCSYSSLTVTGVNKATKCSCDIESSFVLLTDRSNVLHITPSLCAFLSASTVRVRSAYFVFKVWWRASANRRYAASRTLGLAWITTGSLVHYPALKIGADATIEWE